jgi:hypothetical protein
VGVAVVVVVMVVPVTSMPRVSVVVVLRHAVFARLRGDVDRVVGRRWRCDRWRDSRRTRRNVCLGSGRSCHSPRKKINHQLSSFEFSANENDNEPNYYDQNQTQLGKN